jgi:hypothetical protein
MNSILDWLPTLFNLASAAVLAWLLFRWGDLRGYRRAARDCSDVMLAQSRAIESLHQVIEDMVKVQSAPPAERPQVVIDMLERRTREFTGTAGQPRKID